MKFRNPKTGEVLGSIEDVREKYCRHRYCKLEKKPNNVDLICKLPNKLTGYQDGCSAYCEKNPYAAALLMGYEVVEVIECVTKSKQGNPGPIYPEAQTGEPGYKMVQFPCCKSQNVEFDIRTKYFVCRDCGWFGKNAHTTITKGTNAEDRGCVSESGPGNPGKRGSIGACPRCGSATEWNPKTDECHCNNCGWPGGNEREKAKADSGKPRPTLVPPSLMEAVTAVREYGCSKYHDPDNWKRVEPQRYRDALYRHWLAYLKDPNGVDEESGLSHLWHLACNAAFLIELENKP